MRPSPLGGGRILRRTLSVCPSVCPSVPLSLPSVTSFRQPLASRMYFSARTEGRISYGHLGRTDSCSTCKRSFAFAALSISCIERTSIYNSLSNKTERAPAHRARDTIIELLRRSTPDFIQFFFRRISVITLLLFDIKRTNSAR